ncbi:MAG: pyridoxamine 5'-phosphate oxidase family protein [Synergistaceae bacterium]|nr:pyridoxamine 5'-phosphate oxidase family protein [Synergistaceae bacterium]
MKETVALIKEAGVFHIATVDGDQARVRPFGFIMEFEGKMYFTTGNKKDFYKQAKANPKVEISAMLEGRRWLRLSGEAVFDGNAAAKRQAFDVFPNFKDMYQTPENPVFEVFYLKNPTATLYSFTDAPKKIL